MIKDKVFNGVLLVASFVGILVIGAFFLGSYLSCQSAGGVLVGKGECLVEKCVKGWCVSANGWSEITTTTRVLNGSALNNINWSVE